jgi:hypothetical protein
VDVRDVLRMLGQVAGLVGRLTLVLPEVFWLRRRGLAAFERELVHCGVPPAAREVLIARYREALPLNPIPYINASSGRAGAWFQSAKPPAASAQRAVR